MEDMHFRVLHCTAVWWAVQPRLVHNLHARM
jgi:hypothetical protein